MARTTRFRSLRAMAFPFSQPVDEACPSVPQGAQQPVCPGKVARENAETQPDRQPSRPRQEEHDYSREQQSESTDRSNAPHVGPRSSNSFAL